MKSILFIIISCFQLVENASDRSSNKGATTLIIMGANGDLAKRKIWPSVQELIFRNLVDTSLLHIYAGSREPTQTTVDNLKHYFKHLSCETIKDFNGSCTRKIASIVTPCSLKVEQDYEELHHFINSRLIEEVCMKQCAYFICLFHLLLIQQLLKILTIMLDHHLIIPY